MLGTVTRISRQTASGTIRSEQGESFDFDLAAVLTYDMATLAEGRMVHFEAAGRTPCKAMNIALEPPAGMHPGSERNKEIRQLRYVGFQHHGNCRTFRYERITPGQATQNFVVDADLGLFQSFRIAIQDGPTMCMKILTAGLDAGQITEVMTSCDLTEQHIRDYQATLPVPGAKPPKTPRRPSVYPPAQRWGS
uniref:Uncharacterized protein n=1 Tax=Solibacter usitatus (strain Ellin6076) TaxID=234267 RepID=Q027C1_SOLUE